MGKGRFCFKRIISGERIVYFSACSLLPYFVADVGKCAGNSQQNILPAGEAGGATACIQYLLLEVAAGCSPTAVEAIGSIQYVLRQGYHVLFLLCRYIGHAGIAVLSP